MAEAGIYFYISESGSKNIAVMRMTHSGELNKIQDVSVTGKVMPMAISPDRRFLYAALRSEPYAIVSFAIDGQSGKLILLGYTPAAGSSVNLTVDRTGRFLISAINPPSVTVGRDRRSGLMGIMAIGQNGCVQSPYEIVRTAPKMHCALPDPSNRFLFGASCDGDVIVRHAFDSATGIMTPDTLPPVMVQRKSGPRHFKFHPNNRFMYLVNEYDASVYAFRYDVRSGALSEIQVSTALPPDFDTSKKGRASDVHFTPDGKWLYVAVRESGTIAAFKVDPNSGLLTPSGIFQTAPEPRSFCIDPFGHYLFATGQKTKSMWSHQMNPETGALSKLTVYPMGDGPNWIERVMLP